MLRSMTAFGRATLDLGLGRFVVEIQSVNKKFLDVICFCPKELARFEVDIKKQIGAQVARGQLVIRVAVDFKQGIPVAVTPNIAFATKVKDAYSQIAKELGISEEISLSLLARQEGVVTTTEQLEDEDAYRQALHDVVKAAVEKLIVMKDREGACLLVDIEERLERLKGLIDKIGTLTERATAKYRTKLETTLKEVVPNIVDNEERVLREVCVYADRVDIAEEVTRLKAHIEHFASVLKGDQHRVGKKLEFILQELSREINTVGSKASDVEVSRHAVDVKGELERIREQIQNVE